MSKMYDELANWWPLLSPAEDYVEEAAFFWETLSAAGLPPSPTLLELGSGGGSNAFHLKSHFSAVTLSDLSPNMLAMSRILNPDCEHIVGDMRTLRLNRTYDAVFVHDAIEYMLTPAALKEALETIFIHCKPGGAALLVPDHLQETFEPSTDHGGSDGDGRSIRYLEWTYDPDPTDQQCVTDYVYVLREDHQPVRVEHDQHVTGLFPRALWLRLLSEVGFQTEIVEDPFDRELFLARRR